MDCAVVRWEAAGEGAGHRISDIPIYAEGVMRVMSRCMYESRPGHATPDISSISRSTL